MANGSQAKKEGSKGSGIFAGVAIVLCLLTGILVWNFIMGHPSNFQGEIVGGEPKPSRLDHTFGRETQVPS